MTVKFKCTLQSGEIVVGPIMGNGGYLGDMCSHLSREFQENYAEDILRLAIRRTKIHGEQRRIYEPKPGCCAVYLNASAQSQGESVAVSFLGTKFEILEE